MSCRFIEGLAAAALAPFIATVLRHFEASYAAVESGETEMSEAADRRATMRPRLSNANLNSLHRAESFICSSAKSR
jgi:hypothetical protein